MPRYHYRCESCNQDSIIFHLSDEQEDECPRCNDKGSLKKLVTPIRTLSDNRKKSRKKEGDVTEEFIKEARADLKKQKKELQNNR